MWLKIISLLLVSAGTLFLLISLIPVRNICSAKSRPARDWRALSVMLMLFIPGYLAYLYILSQKQLMPADFILSLILGGGGLFVFMVTRLSMASVKHIKHIAALEHYHALHDQLTNLPNRNLLYERISEAVQDSEKKQQGFAVLLMDIDRFREVNDVLGHYCGDRLLQLIAPKLKSNLYNKDDLLARLGGDEFAILLHDIDKAAVEELVSRLVNSMRQPFVIEGHELAIELSIGISMFPVHGEDADSLLQHADVAMYNAKRTSSDYAFYNVKQEEYSLSRLTMLGRLRDALDNDDLCLSYQPIMSLSGNQLWGVEALIRWENEELGLVAPEEFIPLAEQLGMIKQVTRYVLDKVLQQIQLWQQRGMEIRVSVNLSVCDIQDVSFPYELMTSLEKYDVLPDRLNFEITESSVMTDSEQARSVLNRLTDSGFSVSIDDFGTGYSSLSYLKQLPANKLKIDKSFVMNMIEDEDDAVIVRSTIDLAHNMGRMVIAEGVENKDVCQLLTILGCDLVQGFGICKPLEARELESWLTQSSRTEIQPVSTQLVQPALS